MKELAAENETLKAEVGALRAEMNDLRRMVVGGGSGSAGER